MQIRALSNIGDSSHARCRNMALFQIASKIQTFQMFNEEKCQRKIIHTGLAESFYFVKTEVFYFDFDYFWYDASNLMQNKIPHSKLLSPTILENNICWGYHFESRVTKIFTDIYRYCWEVSFSHLLICNCSFRIVYNHLFNHVEWVTHHSNAKKQGVHLTYTQPSPLMPSECGPSST